LILGITFIVELIASLKKKDMAKTKGNRILTNYERFFIFTYLLGGFFKSMHWPGAGIAAPPAPPPPPSRPPGGRRPRPR
jgi:hypothetical protein